MPQAVLGGCTIMMFGNIILSGFQMIAEAGFTQRNITIAALSLTIGIGFTQVSNIFVHFPALFQQIFASNCIAVAFVVALILSLVCPARSISWPPGRTDSRLSYEAFLTVDDNDVATDRASVSAGLPSAALSPRSMRNWIGTVIANVSSRRSAGPSGCPAAPAGRTPAGSPAAARPAGTKNSP